MAFGETDLFILTIQAANPLLLRWADQNRLKMSLQVASTTRHPYFLLFLLLPLASWLTSCAPSSDSTAKKSPFYDQVTELLSQMTTAEKIAELTQDAPANDRLGRPLMRYSECLHGLWIEGATVYPQAIALGSTWEPDLVRQMTGLIAKEARAVNISHCYCPALCSSKVGFRQRFFGAAAGAF